MSLQEQGYTLVEIDGDQWTRKHEKWLSVNVTADYEVADPLCVELKSGERRYLNPYQVWFEDKADALLFKLTFGGAA